MSCALTQGYVQDCRDSIGGAFEMKVIEFDNVESITVAAGIATVIENKTGKRWWTYRPAKDTAYGKSTLNTNVANGTMFFDQEVGMALNKMQTNTRLEIGKLAQNTLRIAVKDRNGKAWLYGYQNGLDSGGGDSGTGSGAGDRNGYNLTFKGQEPEDAIEIAISVYDALETPGV